MHRVLASLAVALGLSAPQGAVAEPVVVELFTSQGCSSCPPADQLLGELAARDDVIALSLHVDYWDYLGWRDEFAQPKFTDRQRGYAIAAHSTMIYTPQMVVGGRDHVVGTRAMQLMDAIQKRAAEPDRVDLNISRGADGAVTISARALTILPEQVAVHLVRYAKSRRVEIKRGENAGRTMTYHHVVGDWQTIGTWDGSGELKMKAPAEGDAPVVVLLQDGPVGSILSAARLD